MRVIMPVARFGSWNIEAQIRFLSTEEGGRIYPAVSNVYRPQFHYDGGDWDAWYVFEHDPVHPGEATATKIRFMTPQAHEGKLPPGKQFQLREGVRVVANGIVVRSLHTIMPIARHGSGGTTEGGI